MTENPEERIQPPGMSAPREPELAREATMPQKLTVERTYGRQNQENRLT